MSEVKLNTEKNRFELQMDESMAIIEFDKLEPNVLDLTHTEVPEELSGKGVGSKLVVGALDYIRDNGLKLIPSCSFIKSYIDKHDEWQDLVYQKKA